MASSDGICRPARNLHLNNVLCFEVASSAMVALINSEIAPSSPLQFILDEVLTSRLGSFGVSCQPQV